MNKKTDTGFLGFQGILRYFQEVKAELAKSQWPTKQQAITLTSTVIAISLAFGVLLGAFDGIFYAIIEWLRTIV
jgi:preprotein translocase SecE subunit